MPAKKTWQFDCQVLLICFRPPLTVAGCLAAGLAVALDKSVNATFGVDDLLLSGVERMAGAANFYADVRFGGTSQNFSAADAGCLDFLIFRMNAVFHSFISTLVVWAPKEKHGLLQ